MPEILTESFCERCGTRYTFESSAPKAHRLGRFRTISKGLKNFVMSDETSLDEALAAARSDEEREATAQQLDAFHKTFNFCMTCRQYTCANCWNEPEGRCLTCAPHLGHDVLPAPFPMLDPSAGLAFDAPALTTNGHEAPSFDEAAWPTADLPAEAAPEPVAAEPAYEPVAAVEQPTPEAVPLGFVPAAEAEPVEWPPATEPVADAAQLEPVAQATADATAPEAGPVESVTAQAAAIEFEAPEEAAGLAAVEPESADAPAAGVPPGEPRRRAPRSVDEKAAAAAAQTAALLARFRPGQSIDEALEAYEAAVAEAAAPSPEAEPSPVPPVEIAAPPIPEAAPAAPATPAAAPQPQPEPVAAADDRVEQPAWRLVAPDTTPRTADGHPGEPPHVAPPPRAPEAAPQFPSTPQWPQPSAASDNLAFLRGRTNGSDDLWAASSRDLMAAAPAAGPAAGGVQSCVSCGLSLSATARFCRRCGTRQG